MLKRIKKIKLCNILVHCMHLFIFKTETDKTLSFSSVRKKRIIIILGMVLHTDRQQYRTAL